MDDARQKIFRWLVETLKAVLSMAVGAATMVAVSCTGIADVLPGLGSFSAETPQERPNEVSALGTQVARIRALADDLEVPVDYWVAKKEVELLTTAMAQQQIDFNRQLADFVKELNNEKARTAEAEARAVAAEADLAQILRLVQPAADAAQGDSE